MVGYDPERSPAAIISVPSNFDYVMAGFSSGCVTRFVCHPLDVVKIRFQLQIEPISRNSSISKYKTIQQTFFSILREETLYAFWKGHVSAQILSGIYGMAYFSSFEILTQASWKWFFADEKFVTKERALHAQPVVHFICGSISGFCGTVLSHPFDVVRTRIVSQAEPRTYLNTRHAFISMGKFEGFSSFYRGFLPTIIQIMPFSGAQFASYNIFKNLWNEQFHTDHLTVQLTGDFHMNIQSSFICGAVSGTFAKLLVYPLDLVKKRLQIRGFENARGLNFGQTPRYNGFIHCIVHTIQHENLAAFYKGLVPSLFKATLSTALHFWLYESFVKFLTKHNW